MEAGGRVRFKPFYARWWGVSPNMTFPFLRYSISGRSAWLVMHGTEKCVPTECLT